MYGDSSTTSAPSTSAVTTTTSGSDSSSATTIKTTTTPTAKPITGRTTTPIPTTSIQLEGQIPLYWSAERRYTHYTVGLKTIWQKYAACMHYGWLQGCEQWRMAMEPYHHDLKYMMNIDSNITNIHEQNPLKCHKIEWWTNTTSYSSVYNMFWEKTSLYRKNRLKVNNKYTVTTIGLETEQSFDCGKGMNSSFIRSYFAPLISQQWDVDGHWYNKTSESLEEMEYDYIEDEEYEDTTTTQTTQTTQTAQTTTTTKPPCNPENFNDTVDWQWTKCDNIAKPLPLKSGMPDLPKPWGNKCPNNLKEHIEKYNLPTQTQTNWLCAADFPNLPIYGNFSIINYYKGDKIVGKEWKWEEWKKILQLGVEHWRPPIILTDLMVQPWQMSRFQSNKGECTANLITHVCLLTMVIPIKADKSAAETPQNHTIPHLVYACVTNITQSLNYKHIATNNQIQIAPIYVGTKTPDKLTPANFNTTFMMNNQTKNTQKIIRSDIYLGVMTKSSNTTAKGELIGFIKYDRKPQAIITTIDKLQYYNITHAQKGNITGKIWYDTDRRMYDMIALAINSTDIKGNTFRLTEQNGLKFRVCWHHEKEGLDPPIPFDVTGNKTQTHYPEKNFTFSGKTYTRKQFNMTHIETVRYVPPKITSDLYTTYGQKINYTQIYTSYRNGIKKPLEFWRTLDMDLTGLKSFKNPGFPYYFYMILPDPEYKEWLKSEWVIHKPRTKDKSFDMYWTDVHYISLKRNTAYLKEHSTTPMLIFRGNITGTKNTYGLYTAHYPRGYIIPPEQLPELTTAPAIIPDFTTPAKVILYPRIRQVKVSIDLQTLKPPDNYCKGVWIPDILTYSSPVRIGRKPLQLLAAGAFVAGAILGGIAGGGTAAAVIAPLKAEIAHIQDLNIKTGQAISTISNSLDALHMLTLTMQKEIRAQETYYKEMFNAQMKLEMTQHAELQCWQYQTHMQEAVRELDYLFTMGLGRRTQEYQTLLDPAKESSCIDGICELHLLQIFIDNSYAAYHTKAIPQKWHAEKLDPTDKHRFVIPIGRYLWTNTTKNDPVYIPIDDTIQLTANVYVYTHIPTDQIEETELVETSLTDQVTNTGDYTFIICTKTNAIITCTNLNETTFEDTITRYNVTDGCYTLKHCSIANLDNGQKNITRVTTLTFEHTAHFDGSAFTDESEQDHMEAFEKAIDQLNQVVTHNQQQLNSIHENINQQNKHIFQQRAELKGLSYVIRSNTYMHKDWLKGIQKCGPLDYALRLLRFNFICTPAYSWFQTMRNSFTMLITGMIIIIVIIVLIKTKRIWYNLCCRWLISRKPGTHPEEDSTYYKEMDRRDYYMRSFRNI